MSEQGQSNIHIVGVVYPDAYVDALQLAIAEGGSSQASELGMVALFVLTKPTTEQTQFTVGASLVQNASEVTSIRQAVGRRSASEAYDADAVRVVRGTLARARSAAVAKQEKGWSVWVPRSEEVRVGHTAVALVFEQRAGMDAAHQRAHEIQREQAGVTDAGAVEPGPAVATDSPTPVPSMSRRPPQRRPHPHTRVVA